MYNRPFITQSQITRINQLNTRKWLNLFYLSIHSYSPMLIIYLHTAPCLSVSVIKFSSPQFAHLYSFANLYWSWELSGRINATTTFSKVNYSSRPMFINEIIESIFWWIIVLIQISKILWSKIKYNKIRNKLNLPTYFAKKLF